MLKILARTFRTASGFAPGPDRLPLPSRDWPIGAIVPEPGPDWPAPLHWYQRREPGSLEPGSLWDERRSGH